MLIKAHYRGQATIGVYFSTNEDFTLVPTSIPETTKKAIEDTLKTNLVEVSVMNTELVGIFVVSNSQGFILPNLCSEIEIKRIKAETGLKVMVFPSRYTVLKNLIVANDESVLLSEKISAEESRKITSFLEVEKFEIWRSKDKPFIGPLMVLTNKIGVVSPLLSQKETLRLSEFLGLPLKRSTVNSGAPFPGMGLVANSKGGLIGYSSTGIEVADIETILMVD